MISSKVRMIINFLPKHYVGVSQALFSCFRLNLLLLKGNFSVCRHCNNVLQINIHK